MINGDIIQHLEDANMWKRGKLKAITTVVLMIAMIAVSVGDSAGSMPGMDTDLGDSDASFWGEDDMTVLLILKKYKWWCKDG